MKPSAGTSVLGDSLPDEQCPEGTQPTQPRAPRRGSQAWRAVRGRRALESLLLARQQDDRAGHLLAMSVEPCHLALTGQRLALGQTGRFEKRPRAGFGSES